MAFDAAPTPTSQATRTTSTTISSLVATVVVSSATFSSAPDPTAQATRTDSTTFGQLHATPTQSNAVFQPAPDGTTIVKPPKLIGRAN